MEDYKNAHLKNVSIYTDENGKHYLAAEYTYETADGKSKYSLSLPMIDLPIPEDALPHFVCPGYDNPKIQLKQEFLHLNGTYRRPAFTNKLIWEKSV